LGGTFKERDNGENGHWSRGRDPKTHTGNVVTAP